MQFQKTLPIYILPWQRPLATRYSTYLHTPVNTTTRDILMSSDDVTVPDSWGIRSRHDFLHGGITHLLLCLTANRHIFQTRLSTVSHLSSDASVTPHTITLPPPVTVPLRDAGRAGVLWISPRVTAHGVAHLRDVVFRGVVLLLGGDDGLLLGLAVGNTLRHVVRHLCSWEEVASRRDAGVPLFLCPVRRPVQLTT